MHINFLAWHQLGEYHMDSLNIIHHNDDDDDNDDNDDDDDDDNDDDDVTSEALILFFPFFDSRTLLSMYIFT